MFLPFVDGAFFIVDAAGLVIPTTSRFNKFLGCSAIISSY
jgi:hypothetical protein